MNVGRGEPPFLTNETFQLKGYTEPPSPLHLICECENSPGLKESKWIGESY